VTTNTNLNIYRNTDGLGDFMRKARSYPLLSAAEESRFIELWQARHDPEAGHRLISSHLRLVIGIANGFRRYGLSLEDLISEGSVGLMQAVDRFDCSRECRLSTYAKWWIRAAIQEHIMRSWSLVRIGTTVAQKKLFFNLRRLKQEIRGSSEGHLSEGDVDEIMNRLQIARHEVVSMEARLSGKDSSLNVPISDADASERIDGLVDVSDTPDRAYEQISEHNYQRRLLGQALATVPERDREIFIKRRIEEDGPTLGELGKDYSISPERVRQIEHSVFEQVRQFVLTEVPEYGAEFH
jgi:RNA polymerase sigma-32 factor|tara:strand:+ start:2449 stop:3336 length:888 start_codon:yes stop_codon:yes gene_type:complete